MHYLDHLLNLTRAEEQAHRAQYITQYENLSLNDKRAEGLVWYPLLIKGTELNRLDYLTVHFERTQSQNEPHTLKPGLPAKLYSRSNPEEYLEGQISWMAQNELKWQCKEDELPEWTRLGKLVLEPLFDSQSYIQQYDAIREAKALWEKHPVLKVISGKTAPAFDETAQAKTFSHLNSYQQSAVDRMVQAESVTIVHGPPGTGKTTTLVAGIQALLEYHPAEKILAVAPSNAAVDWLTQQLVAAGVKVVRVGNTIKVNESTLAYTVEEMIQADPQFKQIKQYRKQAAQLRDMAHQYKRNFGAAERAQRQALFKESKQVMQLAQQTEQYLTDKVIQQAQVITGTLAGIDQYYLKKQTYGTVIIDEAAQALTAMALIPVLKGNKLVLAGDHCQLPPTIFSNEKELSVSLMERLTEQYPSLSVLLQEQYRMQEQIMQFSSNEFYEGRLVNGTSYPVELPASVQWIDTAGAGYEEDKSGSSTYNPEEARFIIKHLQWLQHEKGYHDEQITIIAPYRAQVKILQELVTEAGKAVKVSTVDAIQGQESDIVYISLTRSNIDQQIGFLQELRRMNVAMTRAKHLLIMVGDSSTLTGISFYQRLLDYTQSMNGYASAWNWMLE
ncbi:AAA domain-containing protein [Gynurincola endophyticus]|uniref:AAA domain-containing protein n=1 Tax=Gynurincola endophyticus TaxID=2479004 RepID=UPI000F8F28B9|nr:AAA domain-containing protein [Gynurincola endophyticus]